MVSLSSGRVLPVAEAVDPKYQEGLLAATYLAFWFVLPTRLR